MQEAAEAWACCCMQVTVYWLSHYPSSVADVAVGDWRSPDVIKQDGQAKAKKIVHKLKGKQSTGNKDEDIGECTLMPVT
jgi:hypothetical protein